LAALRFLCAIKNKFSAVQQKSVPCGTTRHDSSEACHTTRIGLIRFFLFSSIHYYLYFSRTAPSCCVGSDKNVRPSKHPFKRRCHETSLLKIVFCLTTIRNELT
jgi:hypothetical protein